jgi:hypothetical protein
VYQIKVDASELKAYGELLKRAGPQMRRDLEADVAATSAFAQRVAREAAPIFRGTLVNTIQVEPVLSVESNNGISITGGIATATPYAIVQDEGRRPNRPMPPLGPITRWVELKVGRGDLQLSGETVDTTSQFRSDAAPNRRRRGKRRTTASRIRSLAFVIARSIGKRGIKGKQFMAKAGDAATPHLEARVNATVERWTKELGGQ